MSRVLFQADQLARAGINSIRSGALEKGLFHLDEALTLWPSLASARVWRAVALLRLGEVDSANQTLHIDDGIDEHDVRSLPLADMDRETLMSATHTFLESCNWIPPSQNMPVYVGDKTENLAESPSGYTAALRNLFEEGFARYLAPRRHLLSAVSCSSFTDLRFWAVRLRRGGSIGAHYHPRSFLSLTFYPYHAGPDSTDPCDGDIVFGVLPQRIGEFRQLRQKIYRPRPGLMLVFPSFIGHAVQETHSEMRISFAADLSLGHIDSEVPNPITQE